MIKILINRLIQSVPVILGAVTISFVMIHIAPGDPVIAILGEQYNPEDAKELTEQLRLNEPIFNQYISYIKKISVLDLGKSYISNEDVTDIILYRSYYTLILALLSMFIAIIFGILLGLLAAFYKDSIIDKLAILFSSLLISSPVFFVALILIYIFSLLLPIFPPSGFGELKYMILPAFALGTRSIAIITKTTRSYMIDILSENYIRTAKAKGLSNIYIIYRHILPNLLLPLITIIGLDLGSYISGAVLTESIFGWPGIGRLSLDSILKRDLPVIEGIVIFSALVFIFINLVIDMLYLIIDPRVKDRQIAKQ